MWGQVLKQIWYFSFPVGCWCFVLPPPPQRVVEVSVGNRNGALGRGGRTVNFGRHGEPVPAWRTSTPCAAVECCTCRSRAPWPAWPTADFQNSHPANIPVSKSR